MRSVPCVRSWRSLDHLPFDDGDFVCPLAFRHKKGEYIVEFCFQGESILLVRACGVQIISRCFTLYFIFLALAMFLMGYSCQGEYYVLLILYMFLVSNYLLIYIYELFIDICLYCMLFEIKNLTCLLVFFPHMRLCILFSVTGNIQVDSIELLSTLATDGQQLGLNFFYEHYFVKGFLLCKL